MSDLTPCPTCQSMLRIPAGAGMIRCPKCKTVLAVEGTAESAAPAPPAPPAAKPVAPPLPFGRPPAKPVAAKPAAAKPAPAKPVAAKPAAVRARLAPVSANDLDDEADDNSPEGIRRRELRQKLREMEEREEREEERFEEAQEHCRWARLGLSLLAYGCLASTLAGFLYVLFVISLLVMDGIEVLFPLAGMAFLTHYLLTAAGFGCCVAGLPQTRVASGVGLGCTILQLAVGAVAALTILRDFPLSTLSGKNANPEGFLTSLILHSSAADNLIGVAMSPFLLLSTSAIQFTVSWKLLVLPWVAAALEFAKVSMIGNAANRHAVEAKAPEVGHQAMRFVHRIFGVVVVGTVLFPLTIPVTLILGDAFKASKFGGGMAGTAMIPFGMVVNAYFLWWTYSWLSQYQTLTDVSDVTRPERVVHEGELAEEY